MQILGIDIGGSGVKGAPVDVTTGELVEDRFRLDTPQPAKPQAVLDTIGAIVQHFDWRGPIGCGYPGVVKNGVVYTAANVDKSWIGYNLRSSLENLTDHNAQVVNDADAAGIAEMYFGAGRGHQGMVVMITLGTGIGVAAFINGMLIPNLELGHLEIDGHDAESRASDAARERDKLSWKKWGKRVDAYLHTLEKLISPDLFIIGGGVSKEWDEFAEFLVDTQTTCVPAQFRNQAGIVGAALSTVYEHDLTP